MNPRHILAIFLLAALFAASSAETVPDSLRLMETVTRLSSEEFAGRMLGSPGNLEARRWLRAQAEEAGLVPLDGWNSPVQAFRVRGFRWESLVAELRGPALASFELVLGSDGPPPERFGELKHWDSSGAAPDCPEAQILYRDLNPAAGDSPSELLDEAAVAGASALILLPHPDDSRGMFQRYRARAEAGDKAVYGLPDSDPRPLRLYGDQKLRDTLAQNIEGFHLELPPVEAFDLEGGNLLYRLSETEGGPVILLVAHYDHLGKADEGFYPGANDNGSGVAVLLETARMLAQRRYPFDLRFLFTDGEEEGFLGARAYRTDMDDPDLLINLDTVGRAGVAHYRKLRDPAALDPDLLMLWSDGESDAANSLASLAEDLGFATQRGQGPIFERAGDHFPFARAGVPSVFVFGGFHGGYHQPDDTADLVLPGKLVRLCDLLRDFLDEKARALEEEDER